MRRTTSAEGTAHAQVGGPSTSQERAAPDGRHATSTDGSDREFLSSDFGSGDDRRTTAAPGHARRDAHDESRRADEHELDGPAAPGSAGAGRA